MTESLDLPDWTKESHLTVTVVDEDPAEVTVIQSDETKLEATVTQTSKDRTITGNINVIARPKGEIETKGTGVDTTGGGTVTLAEYTVTSGKKYYICNLCVACKTAHWIFLYMEGSEVRRYYVPAAMTLIDWFAWDWNVLTGDGSKKVELKALKDNGGETLYADFAGEEV